MLFKTERHYDLAVKLHTINAGQFGIAISRLIQSDGALDRSPP